MKSKKKIFFRFNFDNGKSWGFGHLNRSLSLINIFKKKKNLEINLIINAPEFTRRYVKKNFVKLNTYFLKKENIFSYKKILENDSIIIFDTLGTKKLIIENLKKYLNTKIVSLEDISIGHNSCDLVINSKIFLNKSEYSRINVFNSLKFSILKNEFLIRKFKKVSKEKKIKILISSGGSDYKNMLYRYSSELLSLKNVKLSCLVGPGVENKNKIFKLKKYLKIIKTPKNIKKIIESHDIIITSGGTFMFECICLGKLVLAVENYRHQRHIINYLKKNNVILKLSNNISLLTKNVKKIILDIIFKPKKYYEIQKKAYDLIDGKGAIRCMYLINKIIRM